jgi:hypothetical protein
MERSRLASVLGPDSLTTFAASFKHSGFVGWLGLTRLHGFGVRVVFSIELVSYVINIDNWSTYSSATEACNLDACS